MSVALAPVEASRNRVRRVLGLLWRYAVGIFFCQRSLLAVAVVGWTYRLMQRSALKRWHAIARKNGEAGSFADFIAADPATAQHADLPNWSMRERNANTPPAKGRIRRGIGYCFGAFWRNVKLGAQGLFNTCVLLFPAEVLWLFGWFAGWDNSFNKGYEQAHTGAAVAAFGVVLFIAAMFYVPMAQARHAVTGEWRSFYQFRLVWKVARRRWTTGLLLAAAYALCSLPVSVIKLVPYFMPLGNPRFDDLSASELLELLNRYFLFATAIAFPLYVGLRLFAARAYASALVDGVRAGVVNEDDLAPLERRQLTRLGLLPVTAAQRATPLYVRAPSAVIRVGLATATVLVWFTFTAQIFVSEFFSYHAARGWLNQPLVQLPWYRYVPSQLESEAHTARAEQHAP